MNPTRSTKRTETSRRSSPGPLGAARAAPHALQNFAPSGFSWPQRAQVSTKPKIMCCLRGVPLECARVHDAAGASRHVRDGRDDALARFADRDGGARAGRQRVRRRGRGRVRPPGRRAAPERAGRRDARGVLVGRAAASRSRSAGRASRRPRRRSSASTSSATSSFPAPASSRRACPARSAAGCCCSASSARGGSRDVLEFAIGYAERRLPAARADPRDDRAHAELLESWPGSRDLYLPAPPAGRALPEPGARGDVSAHRRREPRRLARGRDREGARARTTRASSRRRSTASRADEGGLLTGRGPGRLERDGRARRHPRLPRADRLQDAAVGRGSRGSPAARPARGLRPRGALRPPSSSTWSRSAPSSRSRIATRSTATCDVPARRAALARVQRRAARARRQSAAPECLPGRGRLPSVRRAGGDGRLGRADERRHGAPRRRRPLREPDLGDAERRLAAQLAGDPGARLAASGRGRRCSGSRTGSRSSLRPGARPRTTLSPGLALREGEPYLAWGTPGGDQQEQWALHVFLRHVDLGLNLQEAIDAPEFHTDHLISSFFPRGLVRRSLALESRFDSRTRRRPAAARPRGHDRGRRGRSAASAPSRASRTASCARRRTREGCRATRSAAERMSDRGPGRTRGRTRSSCATRSPVAPGSSSCRPMAAGELPPPPIARDARLPARRGRARARASSSASRRSTTTTRSASSTRASR